MNWVKQVGELLPNAYDPETTPQVGELDELETFVGSKKQDLVIASLFCRFKDTCREMSPIKETPATQNYERDKMLK